MIAPAVRLAEAFLALDLAAEDAPAERRVGDVTDPQFRTQGQEVLFILPRPQRVFGLQHGDRMNRVSPAQRVRRGFGEAQIPGLSLFDQLSHGADGLFDRNLGVDTMLVVEVDLFQAEPLKTGVAGFEHILGAPVDVRVAVGIPHVAEFRRDDVVVAAALDGPAQEFLVLAEAVEVGGIEEVDSDVGSMMQGGDALLFASGRIKPRHDHAAEANRRNLETLGAKSTRFHFRSP